MILALGADPFAMSLKKSLQEHLTRKGIQVISVENDDKMPFYETAAAGAKMIQSGKADCAILLCGTGAGMCVVANKFAGISAISVESVFTAAKAKAINRANVITMGAMVVDENLACAMADAWIDTKYNEGLEDIADFLEKASAEVAAIDNANRK